jgi:hypothetical protein
MKTLVKICFLTAVLFCSQVLTAQEEARANGNALYYADLFQWNYGFFEGLTLNFQNQSSIVAFGLKPGMKTALLSYPDTMREYNKYKTKTVFGHIFLWGGLTAVIAGPLAVYGNDGGDHKDYKIAIGVMAGGLLVEIIGSIILQSGYENIFNAVNLYNRYKINGEP